MPTGRPYSSTSISNGTRIVRPSAVVSVCHVRITRRSESKADPVAATNPSPAPTTAPVALPTTAPAATPTPVPIAGPGCLWFTLRPSRFVVHPPAANATATITAPAAKDVIFIVFIATNSCAARNPLATSQRNSRAARAPLSARCATAFPCRHAPFAPKLARST